MKKSVALLTAFVAGALTAVVGLKVAEVIQLAAQGEDGCDGDCDHCRGGCNGACDGTCRRCKATDDVKDFI